MALFFAFMVLLAGSGLWKLIDGNCDILRNACQKHEDNLGEKCKSVLASIEKSSAQCKTFVDICLSNHHGNICKNVFELEHLNRQKHHFLEQRKTSSVFLTFLKEYLQFYGAKTVTLLTTRSDLKSEPSLK